MKVELFYTDGCGSCSASKDELQAAVLDAAPEASWRDIDPVQELDYAVELGVASIPCVAIDGKVVFKSLPTAAQLREAVLSRRQKASDGR